MSCGRYCTTAQIRHIDSFPRTQGQSFVSVGLVFGHHLPVSALTRLVLHQKSTHYTCVFCFFHLPASWVSNGNLGYSFLSFVNKHYSAYRYIGVRDDVILRGKTPYLLSCRVSTWLRTTIPPKIDTGSDYA